MRNRSISLIVLALTLVLVVLVVPTPSTWAKSLLVKRHTAGEERGARKDLGEPSVKKELGVADSLDVAGGDQDGLSRSDDLVSDYPSTVMPDAKLDGSRHDEDDHTTKVPLMSARRSGNDDSADSRGDESALSAEDGSRTVKGDELTTEKNAEGASKTDMDDEEGSRGDSPSDDFKGEESEMTAKPVGSRGEEFEPSDGSKSGMDESESEDSPRVDESAINTEKSEAVGASKSGMDDGGRSQGNSPSDESEMTTAKPEGTSKTGMDESEGEESSGESPSDDSRSDNMSRGDETAMISEAPEGSRGDEAELTTSAPKEASKTGMGDESEGSRGDMNDANSDGSRASLDDDSFMVEEGEYHDIHFPGKPESIVKPGKDPKRPSKHPVPHPRPYYTSPTPSAATTNRPSTADDSKGKTTKKPSSTTKAPTPKTGLRHPGTSKPQGPVKALKTTKSPEKQSAKPLTTTPKPRQGSTKVPSGGLGFDASSLMPPQKGDQVLVLVKSKAGKIEARLPNVA